MFDFFQFLKDNGLMPTAFIVLLIIIAIFIYREATSVARAHSWKIEAIKHISEFSDKADIQHKKIMDMVEVICTGHPCENYKTIAEGFRDLSETIHRFEREARESRLATREAIERIERNIAAFTNDLGREIVRFLRNGKTEV